ncbi:unnamed protein product, partial [Protopolystoma xenopodis]
ESNSISSCNSSTPGSPFGFVDPCSPSSCSGGLSGCLGLVGPLISTPSTENGGFCPLAVAAASHAASGSGVSCNTNGIGGGVGNFCLNGSSTSTLASGSGSVGGISAIPPSSSLASVCGSSNMPNSSPYSGQVSCETSAGYGMTVISCVNGLYSGGLGVTPLGSAGSGPSSVAGIGCISAATSCIGVGAGAVANASVGDNAGIVCTGASANCIAIGAAGIGAGNSGSVTVALNNSNSIQCSGGGHLSASPLHQPGHITSGSSPKFATATSLSPAHSAACPLTHHHHHHHHHLLRHQHLHSQHHPLGLLFHQQATLNGVAPSSAQNKPGQMAASGMQSPRNTGTCCQHFDFPRKHFS